MVVSEEGKEAAALGTLEQSVPSSGFILVCLKSRGKEDSLDKTCV